MILHFLPLIGHNLLLVFYRFEYEGHFYKYSLHYTWVQMLLQIKDVYYAWVQNVITDGTFITLGSKCCYRSGTIIALVPSTHPVLVSRINIKLIDHYYSFKIFPQLRLAKSQ